MSKITKNTIKYGTGLMAIVVMGLLTIAPASTQAAEKPGYYKGYSGDFTDTSYNPGYTVSNTYNPNPNNGYVLGANTSVAKKVVAAAPETDYKEVKEEFSNVTANALYGADSFFPTSIVGWLLFAIFVLIIVILVRKFTGLEKKYHETPLKHS